MPAEDEKSIESILTMLPEAVKGATARRLERLQVLQLAKERALLRELNASMITREDNASTEMIERSIERSRLSQAQLRSQWERLRIRAPIRREGACLVHGRIADELGSGLAGLTVTAVDERGVTLDYARAGEYGYFKLEFGHARNPSIDLTRGRSGRGPSASREPGSMTYEVFLVVANAQGEPVYRDATPTPIGEGGVAYREIVVHRRGV